jgi:hypothetical protein
MSVGLELTPTRAPSQNHPKPGLLRWLEAKLPSRERTGSTSQGVTAAGWMEMTILIQPSFILQTTNLGLSGLPFSSLMDVMHCKVMMANTWQDAVNATSVEMAPACS